ncbi:putative phage abortive infection protein [Pseudovibrio sp. SCP19]|uniref:putative phage abortive infection protein n=1 Tax=Pseudovibrio sp. SCP19 TaxID=3141374 RepID=UPI0033375E60
MQILISLALLAFVCILVFSAKIRIEKRKGAKKINRLALGGFLGVGTVFVLYGSSIYFNWWNIEEDLVKTLGPFGDSFGPLTSFFSALAFAALIWTVFLQREELQLNRTELTLSRQEMADQRFENMLMRMLDAHTKIVSDLDLQNSGHAITVQGKDFFRSCFKNILMRLQSDFNIRLPQKTHILERPEIILLSVDATSTLNVYEAEYHARRTDLAHYFRSLYNILRFISESGRKDKFDYARIVRAQLSDYELAINCLNSLSEHGVEKMKPLIEEFSILDNLPKDLYLSTSLMDQFDPKALKTPLHPE